MADYEEFECPDNQNTSQNNEIPGNPKKKCFEDDPDYDLYDRVFGPQGELASSTTDDADAVSEIDRDFAQAQKTLHERRFGRTMTANSSDDQDRLISQSEFSQLEARVRELETALKDARRKMKEMERSLERKSNVAEAFPEFSDPMFKELCSCESLEPEFRVETTCDLTRIESLLRFLRNLYPHEEHAINVVPVWDREQDKNPLVL